MPTLDQDKRFNRVAKLCAALAAVSCEVQADHATFRVRKKVFAYFLRDHHGDGIVSICCKTDLGGNVDMASREPDRFYLPAYIGKQGWIGMRLDRGRVVWSEVESLILQSYEIASAKPRKRLS
jgi:predicted DNA-binding protein (MmcQ/YjbR family)